LLALACSSENGGRPADAAAPDAPAGNPDAGGPPWLQPFDPNPRGPFPPHFLFGSATSAYQVEGGNDNTDWAAFEPGHVARGDNPDNGPRSRQHYLADVQALVDSKQNAYRFTIEWARLFPNSNAWSTCRAAADTTLVATCHAAAAQNELAYYHDLLAQLRAHNITPMVSVIHSSLPSYIDDLTQDWHNQGWARAEIANDAATYAGFLAGEFGDAVDWWATMVEPLTNADVGYIDGNQPPGLSYAVTGFVAAIDNMVAAHARMYEAIHRFDTIVATPAGTAPIDPMPAAMVALILDVHVFYGATDDPADQSAAQKFDQFSNRLFLDAIVRGNFDRNASGTLDPGEPMNDPTLKNHADYIGVNYYGFSVVDGVPGFPVVGGVAESDEQERGLPKTDFGWDIYPRGMPEALAIAGSYGLPIIVTENGLADATDSNRPRFLAEHLAAVAQAIHAGTRVLGYFHWATIDNFEWTAGFCPRFGLYQVDYQDPQRARTARPSAAVYRQIIEAGEVTDALLAAQPAYRTPSSFCPGQAEPPPDGGS
jgi:beta-glucosidase/6-phospho-beta-glucosidase/beta-galactosidase